MLTIAIQLLAVALKEATTSRNADHTATGADTGATGMAQFDYPDFAADTYTHVLH